MTGFDFYKLYNDTFEDKIDIKEYMDNKENNDYSTKNVIYHVLFANITSLSKEALKSGNKIEFKKFCEFVEKMWQNGDDYVANIVDVTILESLSDDEDIWKEFGDNISNEFKKYINEDLSSWNCVMWNVSEL